MSTTAGNPNIFVNPDLVDRKPWALFRYVEIDTEGTADLLRSWEMPDQAIQTIHIDASPDIPDRLLTISGITTRVPTYHRTVASRITLYMGNVYYAVEYPNKFSTLGQQEREQDASAHAVEALSYAKDEATMGKIALAKERSQAETAIAVKKSVPRALGAFATGALLGIGAYLNHKYNVLTPGIAVDIAGVVGTAAAGALAWKGAKRAIREEGHKKTALRQWPADLRAQARTERYINERDHGLRPELVNYRTNT